MSQHYPCPQIPEAGNKDHGFFYLIAIISLAALSLIFGAALPSLGVDVRQELEVETREEIDRLATGVLQFVEDHGHFPWQLDVLRSDSESLEWQGPYVQDQFEQDTQVGDRFTVDPWQRDYVYYCPTYYEFVIRSKGVDGIDNNGEGDDIQERLTVHPSLWRRTKKEMDALNSAITAYNNFEPQYLSQNWGSAVSELQAEGYLPAGSTSYVEYTHDAWLQPYVPVGNPVTAVTTSGPPVE